MKTRSVMAMLALMPTVTFAQCVKHEHAPIVVDMYYAPAAGLTGQALHTALNQIVRGHTRYSHTPRIWEILREADEAPGDETSVIGFCTGRLIAKNNQDSGQNDPNSWNREHIWAKSHGFPNNSQHAFTDAHHIRAADRSVNSDRSDNDFERGGIPDDECNGCFEGEGTWEPPDRVKRDTARMMFYMDVRYDGNDGSGTPDLRLVDRVNIERSDEGFGEFGRLCTLFAWHQQAPVSTEERRRNELIHGWQGNRNPFIDNPGFVREIWDSRCGTPSGDDENGSETMEISAIDERLSAVEQELQALRELVESLADSD